MLKMYQVQCILFNISRGWLVKGDVEEGGKVASWHQGDGHPCAGDPDLYSWRNLMTAYRLRPNCIGIERSDSYSLVIAYSIQTSRISRSAKYTVETDISFATNSLSHQHEWNGHHAISVAQRLTSDLVLCMF